MHKLQAWISSLLLITTPSLLVYPQEPLSSFQQVAHKRHKRHKHHKSHQAAHQALQAHLTPRSSPSSYDETLQLIYKVESGELENRCTPDQLESIAHFLAQLATEGTLLDGSIESLSLNQDIQELLYGDGPLDTQDLTFADPDDNAYMIIPALLYEDSDMILCKSWIKKRWKHVRKFAKKHRKALIIGAVVVVAATVVVAAVVAASAGAAAATAAGAASVAASKDQTSTDSISSPTAEEISSLSSTLDQQITTFKETIVQEQFFQLTNSKDQLSWEENGRALGSLLAHSTYDVLNQQDHPTLGHHEIDRTFSTDYVHLYHNPSQPLDFHTLSHQVRAEQALSLGYYNQAVQDFDKAIEINPTHSLPYLERGIAHFQLGQYDRSLDDYKQFTSQAQAQQPNPLSVSEFSLGFAKGLPKGVYESGEGLLLFMGDFVQHPIQTSKQIAHSISTLVDLARQDEWGVIAEALSPEVHQLVTQWDTLPSDQKGELAGYAVGKHGADILVPGAIVKVASKSVKSAQELAAVCKEFQIAQKTLVLETAAEIGSSAKITEILEAGRRTARFADELGFTAREMGSLKEAGKLETTVSNTFANISKNPVAHQSFEIFGRAQEFLNPYKEFMPETQCRALIHKTGIPTLPRPVGIPESYRVRISDKGVGLIYVHPEHTHTSIRIMPGKPHSPLPYQQKPYVIHMKDGKALDKFGNKLSNKDAPEAHIPYDEFVYRG